MLDILIRIIGVCDYNQYRPRKNIVVFDTKIILVEIVINIMRSLRSSAMVLHTNYGVQNEYAAL